MLIQDRGSSQLWPTIAGVIAEVGGVAWFGKLTLQPFQELKLTLKRTSTYGVR
jgi:hypothetical protein